MNNKKISKILYDIGRLLEIKGVKFKPKAYQKAAQVLESLKEDVIAIHEKQGLKGLKKIPGIGKSIAEKIEEYIKKGKIKYYEKLKKETAIQQIITYFFETKGLSLDEIKNNAKKKKIVYSRYTRPAKQLLELAGDIRKSKQAINKVAKWAKSRNLDYAIETVFKKWLELDMLKPKEIIKKPFFQNDPMVWSATKKKWFVINQDGEWLEFVGEEKEIEWKMVK
ncbi:hypothetical protein ACFLZ0_00170 [Patescibacteria group bacterium]